MFDDQLVCCGIYCLGGRGWNRNDWDLYAAPVGFSADPRRTPDSVIVMRGVGGSVPRFLWRALEAIEDLGSCTLLQVHTIVLSSYENRYSSSWVVPCV